jgi:hypothetical protein
VVCLRNLRDQRETKHIREEQGSNKEKTGVPHLFIVSTLTALSLADNADLADECSRLHYFADKQQTTWTAVSPLCGICLSSAIICVICERNGCSHIRAE